VVHIFELFNDSFAYFSMSFLFDLTTNLSSEVSRSIFTELLVLEDKKKSINKEEMFQLARVATAIHETERMGPVPRAFEIGLADVNQPIEAQKRGQGLSPTQCSICHLDAKMKIDTNK
jgi:hypothetical protein